MSNEEIARQEVDAIKAYQAAKAKVTHIEQKLRRFFVACRELGNNADLAEHRPTMPHVNGDTVSVGFIQDRFSPTDLMNESELRACLLELEAARDSLRNAAQIKEDMGITLR